MLSQERKAVFGNKWVAPLALLGLAIYAFLLRCLHLFNSDNYHVVSADSYFFHWLARRVMAGEGPPVPPGVDIYTLHSGLAYPIAYIARAVSYVFGVSSADALESVTKFLPPFLAVISVLVVYLLASRLYDRKVGLLSAFAWAALLHAITVGAAGYVDRDGLSILLMMTGALMFFFSANWHLKLGNRDVGWVVAGLGVLVIEGLLYLEWVFVGPLLLVAIIAAYFVIKFTLEYFSRMEPETDTWRRISVAIKRLNYRTFALILLGNIVVGALYFQQVTETVGLIKLFVEPGGDISVVELEVLGVPDLFSYGILLVPIIAALYVTWKERSDSNILFASWFISLLVLSFFSKRVMLYAAPAACFLSGVGLAYLWGWAGRETPAGRTAFSLTRLGLGSISGWRIWGWLEKYERKILMAVLVGLVVLLSVVTAMSAFVNPTMSVDREWQGALTYLREQTPEDAVIMTQWSWGYWILDLANLDGGQRRPFVDNGYYGYDSERLRDVAMAYYTSDPAEAAQLMQKWGVDYLVFSTLDRMVPKTIMGWADVGEGFDSFPANSLVEQSLTGKFASGGGLEVVYRSETVSETSLDHEVVILRLSRSG